jgi:hypothetical protein
LGIGYAVFLARCFCILTKLPGGLFGFGVQYEKDPRKNDPHPTPPLGGQEEFSGLAPIQRSTVTDMDFGWLERKWKGI